MKKTIILITVFLMFALAIASSYAYDADKIMPAPSMEPNNPILPDFPIHESEKPAYTIFYGTQSSINKGDIVTAKIDGKTCGSFVAENQNYYGNLACMGGKDGEEIEFFVNGKKATTKENAVFEDGKTKNVELQTKTVLPEEEKGSRVECGATPTNLCTVKQNTTFNPGTYNLSRGIEIVSLTTPYNPVTLDCNGATINGNNTLGSAGIIIDSLGSNVVIKNCIIQNYSFGIYHSASLNFEEWPYHWKINISSNTILKNKIGVYLSPRVSSSIELNKILNNQQVGLQLYPHLFERAQPLTTTITDNNITSNGDYGVQIYETWYLDKENADTGVILKNNYITDHVWNGVDIRHAKNLEMYDNKIHDNGPANFFDTNGGATIYDTQDIIIKNNTFSYGYPTGIYMEETKNSEISYNNITTNYWYGIYLHHSNSDSDIHDNTVTGQGSNSIHLWGDGFSIENTSIHDNLIENNGFIGSPCAMYLVGGVKDVRVFSNTVFDNFLGICLDGLTTLNNDIYQNTVHNNQHFALYLKAQSLVRVFLNNFYDNNQAGAYTYEVYSNTQNMDVDYAGYGNYWGRSSQPCFVPGIDSNYENVIDNHPYCFMTDTEAMPIPLENDNSWNFFSFNLQPEDEATSIVMAPINSHYDIVRAFANQDSDYYDPSFPPLSDLQTMNPLRGYWLHTTSAPEEKKLFIFGDDVTDCQSITLNPGKHWVGFWLQQSIPASSQLSSTGGSIDYIRTFKDGNWLTYDPENPEYSDLEFFEPGQAYLVKVSSGSSLCLDYNQGCC